MTGFGEASAAVGGATELSEGASPLQMKTAMIDARLSSCSCCGGCLSGVTREITSPSLSTLGSPLVSRRPLTNVPLAEVSSTRTASTRSPALKCTWLPEMRMSFSTIVQFGLRPTVTGVSPRGTIVGSPDAIQKRRRGICRCGQPRAHGAKLFLATAHGTARLLGQLPVTTHYPLPTTHYHMPNA
jgi:hypothetical protein